MTSNSCLRVAYVNSVVRTVATGPNAWLLTQPPHLPVGWVIDVSGFHGAILEVGVAAALLSAENCCEG